MFLKVIILKCYLLLLNNNEPFLNQIVMYDEKWILYNNQLSGCTEKKLQSTSQSQTCTQKRIRSLFGGLLPLWSTTAFWILAKPLHLRNMLSKLMRCTENCSACRQRWSIKWAPFFSRTTPDHTFHTSASKVEGIGLWSLPHLPYSPDLLPTDYHFFKHLHNFLPGKCFHNQQEAKNAFQEFVESQSGQFYAKGINLFLISKNMFIAVVPILINKDVFESRYNDLKFKVQNHNYFSLILIFNNLVYPYVIINC